MSIKWKGNTVAGAGADPYTSNPAMDGAASPGSSNDYARGDHVHPNDTSKADRSELSDIFATGTTNATGSTITNGTFFYLNNALVVAKTDIASGATFTSGTNYEAPTAGALNSLKSAIDNLNAWSGNEITISASSTNITLEHSGMIVYEGDATNHAWGLVQLILNDKEVVKFQSTGSVNTKMFGRGCFHVRKGDKFQVNVANGSPYSVKLLPSD